MATDYKVEQLARLQKLQNVLRSYGWTRTMQGKSDDETINYGKVSIHGKNNSLSFYWETAPETIRIVFNPHDEIVVSHTDIIMKSVAVDIVAMVSGKKSVG